MNYIKSQLDNLVRSLAELRVEFAAKNEVHDLERRVKKIEESWVSWTTWIIRLVGAIIIGALLAVIIKGQ